MIQILTSYLDKRSGSTDKICENAVTRNVNATQNPINAQKDQIRQFQSATVDHTELVETMTEIRTYLALSQATFQSK